jgi:hypothetical protein
VASSESAVQVTLDDDFYYDVKVLHFSNDP